MNEFLQTIAVYLFLALFFTSLIGAVGCGGAAKKKEDEEEDPPAVFDLSGVVLDNDGAPIADVDVTVRLGDGSNGLLDSTTSLANGAYLLRVPEKTPFYVHAEKAAYVDTNTHIREITGDTVGVDVVLLLQNQADSLLFILNGPGSLTPANLLFDVRALTAAGLERTGVTVTLLPIGLTLKYRLADNAGYAATGPTVACTNGGGCTLPQMAGFSAAVNQGVFTFQFVQTGVGSLGTVAAPLLPGEVTFVVNQQ